MTLRILAALVLCSTAAFAQAPRESERRSDSGPAAPILRSQCDKLAGAEHARCVAEEKSARERLDRSQAPQKSCDELFGPERELCLKKGGSVKTGAGATGSSR